MKSIRFLVISVCVGLACLTVFSTSLQAQTFGKGLRFEDDDVYRSVPLASPPLRGGLPEYVDMSPYFPIPGNQGEQGSCVGWAVGYGLKSYHEARERDMTGSSVVGFSPAFIYNQIKLSNCAGGAYIQDALSLLERSGNVEKHLFPYSEDNCTTQPSSEILDRAENFRIKHWRRANPQSITEIQSYLVAGYPVLIGMEVGRNFDRYRGGIFRDEGTTTSGHAMVVVGYDQNKRAFRLFNSWGTDWGDEGYAWVDYDTFRRTVKRAFVAQDWISEPEEPRSKTLVDRDLILSGLRGNVLSTVAGQTPEGWDYFPVSLWMDLPNEAKDQIADVEYWFHHSSFRNPKVPVDDTNVFLTKWFGYGCIENAEVRIRLVNGENLSVPFSLCEIWHKGHTTGGQTTTGSLK